MINFYLFLSKRKYIVYSHSSYITLLNLLLNKIITNKNQEKGEQNESLVTAAVACFYYIYVYPIIN